MVSVICSTDMVSVRVGFGAFLLYFSFLYFGDVFNKTIIPLALVRYEIFIANSMLPFSFAISRPSSTCASGITLLNVLMISFERITVMVRQNVMDHKSLFIS